MTTYRFNNPTYEYKIGLPHDLYFAGYPVAKTVVKYGGAWRTVITPNEDFLAQCTEVLRGGFDHQITEQMAAELIAAGYGDYVVED